MKRVAAFGGLVAVHAENEIMTQRLARKRIAAGRTTVRDYLDSRPVRAELDAIHEAIALAGETGCRLHIVHVSSGEGIGAVLEGRRRGVDVSCETCPHYLTLTEEDVFRRGAPAKCAPPLRAASSQALLWQRLRAGSIDTVGSDHSPAPPDMKTGSDFFKIWGGIAGVQHTLSLLITEGTRRGVTLSQLVAMTSANVAARFRLPESKGRLAVGADADLTLIDPGRDFIVQREALHDRHRLSPYVGRRLRGRVGRTLVRGRTVFLEGRIVSPPGGRLIKPRAA
jgi:allantoinase